MKLSCKSCLSKLFCKLLHGIIVLFCETLLALGLLLLPGLPGLCDGSLNSSCSGLLVHGLALLQLVLVPVARREVQDTQEGDAPKEGERRREKVREGERR